MKRFRPEKVLLLQPTSPWRRPEDIVTCADLLGAYDSAVSVAPTHGFLWRDMLEPDRARYVPQFSQRLRRQEEYPKYRENGAIYGFLAAQYRGDRLCGRMGLHVMPYWSQFELDSPEDLELLQWVMEYKYPCR